MIYRILFLLQILLVANVSLASTNLRPDSFGVTEISHLDGSFRSVKNYTFHGYDRLLLIHGEITTPIEYRDSLSFKVSMFHNGTNKSSITPVDEGDVPFNSLSYPAIQFSSGDFDGDGHQDLLGLSSEAIGDFIIFGSANDRPDRIGYFDQNIGAHQIDDYDGDGKDEIALLSGGVIHTVFDVSDIEVSNLRIGLTKNTSIDYRPFVLGDHIGYLPKAVASSQLSSNKLVSGIDYKTGDVSLTLPLQLPLSDVEAPTLGLFYSGAGYNSIGHGWQLAGESQIEECLAKGVSTEQNKLITYCKDGRELVKVGPGNTFRYKDASAGEISKFTLVSHSIHPYFMEDLRDGRNIRYGMSSLNGGLGNKYKITSISYPDGSVTKYFYNQNGALYQILYGDMRVVFEYSEKGNSNNYRVSLNNGFYDSFIEERKLLTKITIKNDWADLAHYYLGYSTKGTMRLSSVQRCSVMGEVEECSEAYTFSSDESIGFTSNSYDYELTEEQFKYASFYSDSDAWNRSQWVDPKAIFAQTENVEQEDGTFEDKFIVKKVDFGSNSFVQQLGSDQLFLAAGGTDSIKPLRPTYYRNAVDPYFFTPYPSYYGNGCTSVSGVSASGSVQISGPSGSNTYRFNHSFSGSNCSSVPSIQLKAMNEWGGNASLVSPLMGDSMIRGVRRGVFASGAIPFDANTDGVAEVASVFIVSDDSTNTSLNLEVSVVGNRHPITNGSSQWDFPIVSIPVSGSLIEGQEYDFKVSPIVDFDGDLNPELVIRANHEYYRAEILRDSFELQLRKIDFANSSHKALFDLDPFYLDINGDGVTDVARLDASGLKAFISTPAFDEIPTDANKSLMRYAEEVNQPGISNSQFSENGLSVSNVLTYDFNGDGKDDLLVLKTGSAYAQIYLSNGQTFDLEGELSSSINIKAGNINNVKVVDYDRDGVPEIIEWVEVDQNKGSIRVVEPESNLGKIASVEYGGKSILRLAYEDVLATGANPEIMLPPFSRKAAYGSKVKSVVYNNGANGWIKEELSYSGLTQNKNRNKTSFLKTVRKTSAAPYKDLLPLDSDYQPVETSSFKYVAKARDFYLDTIDTNKWTVDGEAAGITKAFRDKYLYLEKEFSGELEKSNHYISSEVERLSSSIYHEYSTFLQVMNSRSFQSLDDLGRIDYKVSVEDGLKTSIDYTYDSDFPLVITKEEQQTALVSETVLSDASVVGPCAAENTIQDCDGNTRSIELYLSGGNVKTALVGKVTHFDGSPLESTIEYSYVDIQNDSYDTKGLYPEAYTLKDGTGNLERVVNFGQPQYGKPSTIKKADQNATSYTYNPFGQVLTQTEPNGASITNTYDGLGRITSSISNVGADTTTSYQACSVADCPAGSYLYQETIAVTGEKVRHYFDINGVPNGSAKTNSAGQWLYNFNQYDIKGRIAKSFTNAQSISSTVGTEYQYRADDLLAKIVEPKGAVDGGVSEKVTTFSYDFINKSSLSNQVLAGKLDLASNSLVKQTTKTEHYDALTVGGVSIPEKTNTTVSWSVAATDRLLANDVNTAKSTATLYSYDVWGRNSKTEVIGLHGNSAGGLSTAVTSQEYLSKYDSAGNLVLSDRPGRDAINHTYNAFGELTKTTTADDSVITMTYDAVGNLKTKSYSGVAASNVTAKNYTWNYHTSSGLLENIQDTTNAELPSTVENFTYKPGLPLVDIHTKVIDGQTYTKGYSYDEHGRIITETFNSGFGFTHGYTNGQLSSVTDLQDNSIWKLDGIDRQGRPTQKTYFGRYAYHQAFETYSNQLTSRYLKLGEDVLDGEELFFDPFDNLALKVATNGAVNTDTLRMSYDNKNRLTQVSDNSSLPTQGRAFAFDDFGNFIYKDSSDAKYFYDLYGINYNSWISSYKLSASSGDQLIGYSPSTAEKEGAGHVTHLAGFDLSYNEMGQPLTMVNAANDQITFAYGPNDELVSVQYNDGRALNLWGNMQHVTLNAGGAGQAAESYYRFRKNAAIILQGEEGSQYNGRFVVHLDHLGSVRSLWNSAGADANASWLGNQTFDAYGRLILSAQNSNGLAIQDITDAGYTGHLMIQGTDFIHMNARLYEARAGIFTSIDPVFADMYRAGGLNAYGYVYGNPFSFVDPTGMNGLQVLEDYQLNSMQYSFEHSMFNNDIPVIEIDVRFGDQDSDVNLKTTNQILVSILPPAPSQGTIDFWGGFGDSASFGATLEFREFVGISGVDTSSLQYQQGGVYGAVHMAATGSGLLFSGLRRSTSAAFAISVQGAASDINNQNHASTIVDALNIGAGFVYGQTPAGRIGSGILNFPTSTGSYLLSQ